MEFLTSSRPSTAGILTWEMSAFGFRLSAFGFRLSHSSLPFGGFLLPQTPCTPRLAGLQGVSRLSDIDRRDLLGVPNPAAPDALERRLNSLASCVSPIYARSPGSFGLSPSELPHQAQDVASASLNCLGSG